jgi:hypothetical protein
VTDPNATGRQRRNDANVELNLRLRGTLTVDELGERSTQILDALRQQASDIALGAQVLEDADREYLSLRLDVVGTTNAEVLQNLSQIMAIVEREIDVPIDPIGATVTFTGTLDLDADKVPWLND